MLICNVLSLWSDFHPPFNEFNQLYVYKCTTYMLYKHLVLNKEVAAGNLN